MLNFSASLPYSKTLFNHLSPSKIVAMYHVYSLDNRFILMPKVTSNKYTVTGHNTQILFQGTIFFTTLKFSIHFEICYFNLKKWKNKRCVYIES